MPFHSTQVLRGMVYEPPHSVTRRHNCRDCFFCQMCSEERCRLCRQNRCAGRQEKACCRRKPCRNKRDG